MKIMKYKCLECGKITDLEDMPHYMVYNECDGDILKDAVDYCPECEAEGESLEIIYNDSDESV